MKARQELVRALVEEVAQQAQCSGIESKEFDVVTRVTGTGPVGPFCVVVAIGRDAVEDLENWVDDNERGGTLEGVPIKRVQ